MESLRRGAGAGRIEVFPLVHDPHGGPLPREQRREADEAATAIRLLDATGVTWVSCEGAILQEAARIKSGGGLSVADAWIAATAAWREAVLVHKDPEFARISHVEQERLPR